MSVAKLLTQFTSESKNSDDILSTKKLSNNLTMEAVTKTMYAEVEKYHKVKAKDLVIKGEGMTFYVEDKSGPISNRRCYAIYDMTTQILSVLG